MKKETKSWLDYAEENLKSADVLLQSNLFNPCLQSLQQAIEKHLKAILIEKAIGLAKSHSIRYLVNILSDHNITVTISEDDIVFNRFCLYAL